MIIFPIDLIFYWINMVCGLIKRNTHVWVFGSHFGFRDNSMFLYYEVREEHPEIRAIWISHAWKESRTIRSMGVESYYWLSPQGLYYCLTAGVYVCTQHTKDICRFGSGGALYLNLNHGIGIKKCYWKNTQHLLNDYGKTPDEIARSFSCKIIAYVSLFRTPDICLATSVPHAIDFFCPMFRIPLSRCIFGNQPRNKILLMKDDQIRNQIVKHGDYETLAYIDHIKTFRKVFVYMPTWRDDGSDFLLSAQIDFGKLNEVLMSMDALFILKLHPATMKNLSEISSLPNIEVYDSKHYIYYILPYTDCLITDYSSVYTDYLIMNKEIILFPFDQNAYFENCTDIDNYDDYYLGVKVYDFESLLSLIQTGRDCHVPLDDYKKLMNYFWGCINNSLDIVEEVKKRQVKYENICASDDGRNRSTFWN